MQFSHITIAFLTRTIRNFGWVDLPSHGVSMYPLIQEGNICRFAIFDPNHVKKGDILLYCTNSGQLIAHRLVTIKFTNGEFMYELKGDTNLYHDKPISKDQILGKLITINKRKKKIYLDDFSPVFWSYVVLSLPGLSKILKLHLAYKYYLKEKLGLSL